MRVIFMGSPDFAVPTLKALIAAGHDVCAVYCQPPRKAGRGMADRPTPVQAAAEAAGLPVFTPKSLRPAEEQERFRAHGGDVGVVVAYGLLLPEPILEAPRHGCLNLHPSALPRWRGAAPLQRTLMAGDTTTAAIIMRMDAGLDTGPVALREAVDLDGDLTAGDLHDAMAQRGAVLMVEALRRLEAGDLPSTPQREDGVTYADKIDKAEARIDWQRPAYDLHNHVRGLSPFPGAWFEVAREAGRAPERVKVLRTAVVDVEDTAAAAPGTLLDGAFTVAAGGSDAGRALRLIEAQRAGKKPMSGAELLRGLALPLGTRLPTAG